MNNIQVKEQNDLFAPDYDRFYQALDKEPEFDGAFYDSYRDKDRLTAKQKELFELMKDGLYRTVPEMTQIIGGTQTGASAAIRNFRKLKFGGYLVQIRNIGKGLYQYRLDVNGYDPETYEYVKCLAVLKWKLDKITKYEALVMEYPTYLTAPNFIASQSKVATVLAQAYSATILLELIQAKSKMRLAHLEIINKKADAMLQTIKSYRN